MSTPMRIATYALALVVVLIASMEVGFRLRPVAGATADMPTASSPTQAEDSGPAGTDPTGGHDGANDHSGSDARSDAEDTSADHGGTVRQPEGLASTVDGYQLTLLTPRPVAGPTAELRLLITSPDGEPLTAYDTAHGKQLHLIVVRRDLASYQHLHPVLDSETGVWTATIDATEAGTYRVFSDLVPTGHDSMTLGTDLAVGGDFEPAPVPTTEERVAQVDGYRVELSGDVRAGQTGSVTATISRDGRPVTDLDPYLEAYGHLVALRQSDLAYLHVHPDGHPGDGTTAPGPDVDFAVEVPSAGLYRLFLDFSHGGVVRTAPFVLTVDR